MSQAKVALLTERRYEHPRDVNWYIQNILDDDAALIGALRERGIDAERIDWSRPGHDWSMYQCVVFRTTWDYFDRFGEFQAWLARAERQVKLVNPAPLIRWNWDKRYLLDLQSRDIPIVQTVLFEAGDPISLAEASAHVAPGTLVLKPAVSGAARHTYRVTPDRLADHETIFTDCLAREAMILQPFQRSITEHGELSLMVIGGRLTHAVRKVAKAGDFRVQDDHGGKVLPHDPTDEEVEFAQRAIAACEPVPAYGRVDIVRDNTGQLAVMELELIEPELWLRRSARAAAELANAIKREL